MTINNMMIFTGNANPRLALKTAEHLNLPLGKVTVGRFSDGEVMVEIAESVRGRDVYIVQPVCSPTNDNLMELIVMADALRRASAVRLTAVIPYLGYTRQDRRPRSARVPITAKVVANMIASAGIDRVMTVDLHADQIQGFFDVSLDNIYASPVLLGDLWKHEYPDLMVVSPDVGGVGRARELAKRLTAPLSIIDKRREKAGEVAEMHVIGDVTGKCCLIIDDICDTAGTLVKAAETLMEQGAKEVHAYITHGVMSGPAVGRIANSSMKSLVLTDSIEATPEVKAAKNIRIVPTAPIFAQAILNTSTGTSVSSLFDDAGLEPLYEGIYT